MLEGKFVRFGFTTVATKWNYALEKEEKIIVCFVLRKI